MVNNKNSRVIIIDFGRTLNIDKEEDNIFLRENLYKNTIGIKLEMLNDVIYTLKTAQHAFDTMKYETVDFIKTFDALVSLDLLFNNISFRYQRPQLINVMDSIDIFRITNQDVLPIFIETIKQPFPETKLELFSFKNTLGSYIRQKGDTIVQKLDNNIDSLEMIIQQQTSLQDKSDNFQLDKGKVDDIKIDKSKVDNFRAKHIIKKEFAVIKRFFSEYPEDFYDNLKSILYKYKPADLHFYIGCLKLITENPNTPLNEVLLDSDKYITFQSNIYSDLIEMRNESDLINKRKENMNNAGIGGRSVKRRRYKRTKNNKHFHRKTRKY
jgi:hypothetical protein